MLWATSLRCGNEVMCNIVYGTPELPYSIQIHWRYVDMLLYYVDMLLRYVDMLLYYVDMLLR